VVLGDERLEVVVVVGDGRGAVHGGGGECRWGSKQRGRDRVTEMPEWWGEKTGGKDGGWMMVTVERYYLLLQATAY
jgi:hypothetical protein